MEIGLIRLGLSGAKIITKSAFIVSMFLATGSGGNSYVSSTNIFVSNSNNVRYLVEAVKQGVPKKNQISKQIDVVKKAFSLNDDEVSKILGISRKTLYTWKNNDSISRDKSRRKFFDLYMLAKNWLELSYPTDRNSIFSKEFNNETVFSLLNNFGKDLNNSNKDKILFVGRYLLRNLDSTELLI